MFAQLEYLHLFVIPPLCGQIQMGQFIQIIHITAGGEWDGLGLVVDEQLLVFIVAGFVECLEVT